LKFEVSGVKLGKVVVGISHHCSIISFHPSRPMLLRQTNPIWGRAEGRVTVCGDKSYDEWDLQWAPEKQSQFPAGGRTAVARALAPVDTHGRDAHATRTPDSVTTNARSKAKAGRAGVSGRRLVGDLLCETKPNPAPASGGAKALWARSYGESPLRSASKKQSQSGTRETREVRLELGITRGELPKGSLRTNDASPLPPLP